MSKTYDGACMALPKEDAELFRQINAKTAQRRQTAEQVRYFDNLYADNTYTDTERKRRELNIRKALPWVAAVLLSVLSLLLGRMM